MQKKCVKININFLIVILGGAFDGVIDDNESPFGYKKGEGIDAGKGEVDWICDRDRERTDTIFDTLNPIDGKISGAGRKIIIFFYRLFFFIHTFLFQLQNRN